MLPLTPGQWPTPTVAPAQVEALQKNGRSECIARVLESPEFY